MNAVPKIISRPRLLTAPLLLLTIALGLASRRYADALPQFIVPYAGDALWAAMVFWIAAFIRPRANTRTLAAVWASGGALSHPAEAFLEMLTASG